MRSGEAIIRTRKSSLTRCSPKKFDSDERWHCTNKVYDNTFGWYKVLESIYSSHVCVLASYQINQSETSRRSPQVHAEQRSIDATPQEPKPRTGFWNQDTKSLLCWELGNSETRKGSVAGRLCVVGVAPACPGLMAGCAVCTSSPSKNLCQLG